MTHLFDDNTLAGLAQPVATIAPASASDILAASQALETTVPVTVPGMTRDFLPHQAAGYLYLQGALMRRGCAVIGDAMGLGKTQLALAAIATQLRQHGGYAIVIAPPVTKLGYVSDIAAAFPGLRFHHVHGRKGKVADLPQADIYWLTDDSLTLKHWLTTTVNDRHGKPMLVANDFARDAQILVVDELHRHKGQGIKPTLRAKVSLAIGAAIRDRGRPVIGLTGTLLTNRPVEAYIPLQIVGGKSLVIDVTPGATAAYHFVARYCNPRNTGYGNDYTGCDRALMPELHNLLRTTVYLRRDVRDLKTTVLPHGSWIVTPLALNGVLTEYRRIEREFIQWVLENKGPEAAMRANRARAITQMQALWQAAAKAKIKAVAEYVSDLVAADRSVVLFYAHTAVADQMGIELASLKDPSRPNGKGGYLPVDITLIRGGQADSARQDAVRRFQAGTSKVMLAQVDAAGIGVTLTSAADAVFVQLPWSAGSLAQAAGRILRTDQISQDRAKRGEGVRWHVPLACHEDGKGTFEAHMWGVLEAKAEVTDAVNAGRQITIPDEAVTLSVLRAWYDSVS